MLLPDLRQRGWSRLREAWPEEGWIAVFRTIAARHGLPEAPPVIYPTGSAVVARLGEVVIKLDEPRWRLEQAAEAAMLARAQGRLPVSTPDLLFHEEIEGWPYVIMSVVQGLPLVEVWPALSREERTRLAGAFGELIRALGELPVEEADRASWEPFLDRMRSGAQARLASRRDAPDAGWLEAIPAFLEAHPPSERPLQWMHTELMGDHVLVARRGGRWELSALLDFADARVGHPFYELPALAEFCYQGEPGLARETLLAMGLTEGELGGALSAELGGWSLLHQFGSVTRMLGAISGAPPSSFAELSQRLYPL